jgi:molybdopterin converting factor small subunit
MKVQLVAFGIAKEILKAKQREYELPDGSDIARLKYSLYEEFPDFTSLKSLSFAVGENYQQDNFVLRDGDEVVILPPVSGG